MKYIYILILNSHMFFSVSLKNFLLLSVQDESRLTNKVVPDIPGNDLED